MEQQLYNGPDVGAAPEVKGCKDRLPTPPTCKCKPLSGSKDPLIRRPVRANVCATPVQRPVHDMGACMSLDRA